MAFLVRIIFCLFLLLSVSVRRCRLLPVDNVLSGHWDEQSRSDEISVRDFPNAQQCYPFTYMCECAFVINHTVSFNHTQQQYIFENFLAWNISDIRLLSSVMPQCRHAIIACFCGLTFPQCTTHPNGTTEITPTCLDVCTTTVPMMCATDQARTNTNTQPHDDQIPNQTPNLTPRQSDQTTNQTQCHDITPLPPTIPVLTCLPEGHVDCCTDLMYMDQHTQECALVCINEISDKQENTLEIVVLVLFWTSFAISVFGLTPFLLDSYARSFPNHIPICIIISSNLFALLITSGSYTNAFQPGSFTCDRFSSFCLVQMFFICWFGMLTSAYTIWLTYRIAYSVLATEFPQIQNNFIHLTNQPSHIFFVHVTTNIFCITALICVLIARRSSLGAAIAPGGYCVPNVADDRQFYCYYVPMTFILAVLTIFLIIILVQFSRITRQFVQLQMRATIFSILVFINSANILIFLYINLGIDQPGIIQAAIECSVTHPQLNDPPCNTDVTTIVSFNHYLYVMIYYAIFPALKVLCISLTHIEVWQWWSDVAMCRPYHSMSERLNPRISRNSRLDEEVSSLSHARFRRGLAGIGAIDAERDEANCEE